MFLPFAAERLDRKKCLYEYSPPGQRPPESDTEWTLQYRDRPLGPWRFPRPRASLDCSVQQCLPVQTRCKPSPDQESGLERRAVASSEIVLQRNCPTGGREQAALFE